MAQLAGPPHRDDGDPVALKLGPQPVAAVLGQQRDDQRRRAEQRRRARDVERLAAGDPHVLGGAVDRPRSQALDGEGCVGRGAGGRADHPPPCRPILRPGPMAGKRGRTAGKSNLPMAGIAAPSHASLGASGTG